MALILCIETSTKACSSALYEDNNLLASRFQVDQSFVHSERLNPAIEQLFEESGRKIQDLEAVAISKGPGSYTGLRIGNSSAKGFCFALGIPLIAIDTLELMFLQAKSKTENTNEKDLFIPMIDARRMEVYTAIFSGNGERLAETNAKIIDELSFSEELKNNLLYFFGDGMEKIRPTFSAHKNAFFIADIHPNAAHMGNLVFEKWKSKQFEDLAYFEPFYLKDFVSTQPK